MTVLGRVLFLSGDLLAGGTLIPVDYPESSVGDSLDGILDFSARGAPDFQVGDRGVASGEGWDLAWAELRLRRDGICLQSVRSYLWTSGGRAFLLSLFYCQGEGDGYLGSLDTVADLVLPSGFSLPG